MTASIDPTASIVRRGPPRARRSALGWALVLALAGCASEPRESDLLPDEGPTVVFQTWISYQNPKFISIDKEANNDVMHFVKFGETNRLPD